MFVHEKNEKKEEEKQTERHQGHNYNVLVFSSSLALFSEIFSLIMHHSLIKRYIIK